MLLNIKIMRDPDEQRIKGIIAPHQANVTVGSTTRVVDASYVGLERDRAVSLRSHPSKRSNPEKALVALGFLGSRCMAL